MSETSSEKQDSTSLDEDSGHDSVDEISSERERIACLETAVNWIRDEVTQLKDYDRDILQELWRIRNTIHTIKDVHKKVRREESRFLDEAIEDRSPTPESIPEMMQPDQKQLEKPQQQQQQPPKPQRLITKPTTLPEAVSERTSMISSQSDQSPPPSPVQSPEFTNAEGEVYKTGTLQLLATAPTHLKKSSDEKLLEEFFGSDHVNKFDIFNKSQSSLDKTSERDESRSAAEKNHDGGHMTQGKSMPNISAAPSNQSLTVNDQKQQQQQQQQGSPYKQYETHQPPVQRRLQIPRNPNSDANRISYDVCSEMEKLRARLQETAIQELAEFDRKYSPKFIHSSGSAGGSQVSGGIADSFDGRRSGEISMNHSRQGSLDSSMSSQPTSSTNLIQPVNGIKNGGGPGVGGGHVRQYSLPIDPNYYRQLQQERSSNGTTPPNMSPRGMRTGGIVIGRKVSGSSRNSGSNHHISPSINNIRSPSPPPVGHVRQISGASAGSSESGTISPPLVIGSGFRFPSGMGRLGDGADPKGKQSKPPGMTRIPSNGPPNSSQHHHHQQQQQHQHGSSLSTSSPAGVSSFNSNSNNRHSPEAQFPPSQQQRSHSLSQPHYATGALKRGKRNSGEIQGDQVGTYQSLYHHNQQSSQLQQQPHQQQQQQHINASKPLNKTQSYDEKVRLGFRPHTYEKLSSVRDQVDASGSGGYQDGFGKRPPLHPRTDTSKIPASPHMGRAPIATAAASLSSTHSNGKVPSEDIQPYMTSAQLKHQMKSYTPFSSHVQQQRTHSMSAADPPRMQKRGSGSSGSGKPADQRTWI